MKKLLFILLLAFANQLFAYQITSGSTYAFADLLVWKLREAGTDNWAQNISPAGTNQSATIIDVPFNWSEGIRVGVGHRDPDDAIDTVLYYTNFSTTGFNNASGIIYSSFLGNFFVNNTNGSGFGPTYQSASIQWHFLYNTIDLEAGHTFLIDQLLKLHPFIGLKTAFINQKISSNWYNPTVPTTFTVAQENETNNFFGIGPSLGVNTIWPLYSSSQRAFNLFGDFSGAVLRGYWRFSEYYVNNTPANVRSNFSSLTAAAPMTRAFVGLEYATVMYQTNVSVRLGYEAQVWFNQLQMYSFNMGRLNNLMSLQGGTLDLHVNF